MGWAVWALPAASAGASADSDDGSITGGGAEACGGTSPFLPSSRIPDRSPSSSASSISCWLGAEAKIASPDDVSAYLADAEKRWSGFIAASKLSIE